MYDDLASLFGAGTAAELGIQSEIVDRAHRLYPEDEVGTPPQGTQGCFTGTRRYSRVLYGYSQVLTGALRVRMTVTRGDQLDRSCAALL